MKKGRLLANAYLVLVFGFLYVPIAVLIAFSFNESKSRTVFTGFTFKWYQNLFHKPTQRRGSTMTAAGTTTSCTPRPARSWKTAC